MPALQPRGSAPYIPVLQRPGRRLREGANQQFVPRDLLLVSSTSGQAYHAAGAVNAPPTNNTLVTSTSIGTNRFGGVAVAPSSGVTNQLFTALEPLQTELVLQCYSTNAVAPTNLNQIGKSYPLRFIDPNVGWVVDVASTSNPIVEVTSVDESWPVGENGGYLRVRLLASVVTGG
jgi:hypothetical protein